MQVVSTKTFPAIQKKFVNSTLRELKDKVDAIDGHIQRNPKKFSQFNPLVKYYQVNIQRVERLNSMKKYAEEDQVGLIKEQEYAIKLLNSKVNILHNLIQAQQTSSHPASA